MLPMPAITCWSSSSGFSCRRAGRHEPAAGRPRSSGVGERVDAELRQLGHLDGDVVGVEHDHLAERARVDEPQLGRPGRRRCSTTWVCGGRSAPPAATQQLAAHPQVDHQPRRRCRAAASRYLPRRSAAVTVAPVSPSISACARRPPHRALAADLDALDPPPDDVARRPRRTVSTSGSSGIGGRRAPPCSAAQAASGGGLLGHLLRPPVAVARAARRRPAPWRRTAWRGRGRPRG